MQIGIEHIQKLSSGSLLLGCGGGGNASKGLENAKKALETDGQRVHTFPDSIITIDADTGNIMTTADIADGQSLYVIAAGYEEVMLGAGLKSKGVYKQVEEILDIDMVEYLKNLF